MEIPECARAGSPIKTETKTTSLRLFRKKNGKVKGSGILIEQLRFALKERKNSILFYGIRYERLSEDLPRIEKLVED